MAKRLELIDEDDVLLPADYPDEDELPTNQLRSGNLAAQQSVVEEIDWLLKLRTRNLTTQRLSGDALRSEPRPSGMAAHTAPARIVPTLGARFTTGLRRGTLLLVLTALVVGALGGGGYLLASTSWLSNFASQQAPPATSDAAVKQSVPDQGTQALTKPATLPANNDTRDSHDTSRGPVLPQSAANGPSSQDTSSSAETSVLSGLDARNLRDQGIAAYRAGNYIDAIKDLEASISITSDDPVAQYQLGLSYMASQGREHALDDAELAFRTAISLQPGWAAPYQMMAETLMRGGYYEQAVPLALQATQLDPVTSDVWMTLGRAYSGAGRDADATRAFAQATKYAHAPQP
jgi:Flp pilus assembly protein TadD